MSSGSMTKRALDSSLLLTAAKVCPSTTLELAGSGGFRSLGEDEAVEVEVEQSGDGRTKATKVTGPDEGPVQGGNEERTKGKK